jgi:hypothetical protein
MPDFYFLEGSRTQALYREGRLKALHFDDWGGPIVTWRLACEYCGEDFESSNSTRRYCSPSCKGFGQREKNRLRVAKHRSKNKDS